MCLCALRVVRVIESRMRWGLFWKRKISLLALLFVDNVDYRSAIFCEAISPMSMKRVINHIIMSLLYTIIICLIKMHRTTGSSDVCDVENIITWYCVEPKTFSVDQYWTICSLYVIKISIISKIISIQDQFMCEIMWYIHSMNHCKLMVQYGYMWSICLISKWLFYCDLCLFLGQTLGTISL